MRPDAFFSAVIETVATCDHRARGPSPRPHHHGPILPEVVSLARRENSERRHSADAHRHTRGSRNGYQTAERLDPAVPPTAGGTHRRLFSMQRHEPLPYRSERRQGRRSPRRNRADLSSLMPRPALRFSRWVLNARYDVRRAPPLWDIASHARCPLGSLHAGLPTFLSRRGP